MHRLRCRTSEVDRLCEVKSKLREYFRAPARWSAVGSCEIYLLSKSQVLEIDFRNIMELVSKPVAVERSADIVVRA
jgi:hypothetical protein